MINGRKLCKNGLRFLVFQDVFADAIKLIVKKQGGLHGKRINH